MRTTAANRSRVLDVQRDASLRNRRAGVVVALATARRSARSGALWGALFGVLVMDEGLRYESNFPTPASREAALEAGKTRGLTAVIGPARHVDTFGGWMAWRTFGLLIILGAIWGLLTATRLLRREEDTGRWELFLAGQTARRHAAVQAVTGLAIGFVVLWTLTAAFTLASGLRSDVDLPVTASMFYATAVTASAAMFLAIGALTSQLSSTRRQANGLAAAAFGLSYLIRMIADSGAGLAWMRWGSPLGWVENLRPLTGSQPLALLPIVGFAAAAIAGAIAVAGRRDLGAGVLVRRGIAKPNTRLLGGAGGLAVRLERWVAVAWTLGLAVLALIFGVTAVSVTKADGGADSVEQAVGRIGGEASGARAWIGYEFLYIAALVAFAAVGQLSALRSEEADGHLDNLLARPVSRARWLGGRLAFGALFVAVSGLATGVGAWVGIATGSSDLGFATMVGAGLNVVAPALFVLGLGTLLYGLVPRLALPILYGVVLWSLLIEIIGTSITTNHWLLDTALVSHIGPVPATTLNWTAIAWLTGLGVMAALAGLGAFRKRDLVAA